MPRSHKSKRTSRPSPTHRPHRKNRTQQLNWLWILLGGLVLIAVLVLIFSGKKPAGSEITAVQAYEKYQQGAFFLDVRSKEEWDQEHIPGSTLIPLDELPGRLDELPGEGEIVVICQSGRRSLQGMTLLVEAGFSEVSCMTGGILAWSEAGYPLETTP
jgi:rhodanese-related sulfurtransferase